MDNTRRVLFLDLTCPKPYDADTLANQAMGGTEATVVRVAEALSDQGYEVIVAQHNRLEQGSGKANYTSFETLDQIQKNPHAVIALRTPKLIPFIQKTFGQDPKLFLWCHDFNHQEIIEDYPIIQGTGVKILGVSRTHKTIITDALLSQLSDVKGVTTDYVYNPVSDELVPDATAVDPNKLVFFSSPHKGLDQTLYMFGKLKQVHPAFTLIIANPGYYPDKSDLPESVINLGSITHAEMMKELRSAFSVFHMNSVFHETFGLVYAEAMAVGTPVLAAAVGAVPEVLGNRNFYVNVKDEKEVIDRLAKWKYEERPSTKLNPDFRLSNVIAKWKELLK